MTLSVQMRKWLWTVAALLGAVLRLVGSFVAAEEDAEWDFAWKPRTGSLFDISDAIIPEGAVTSHGILSKDESGVVFTVTTHLGPFIHERHRFEKRFVLATNELHVGDRLYSPTTMTEVGRVLGVEKWHEFDDGTERAGVLVLSADGLKIWTPKDKMGKLLVQGQSSFHRRERVCSTH